MTRKELAALIDHTQVRAFATELDISELCDEAVEYGFHAVTINAVWTSFCARRLADKVVGIDPTIGFPLGASTAQTKVAEAREAVKNGATELDMVINIGALRSGYPVYVEREIEAVVRAAGKAPVKVILETSYLTDQEKVAVCEMSVRAGAAFVKTSTGFGHGGATLEDVALMRRTVGNQIKIKASGGIRSYEEAVAFIEAGADRLGTSTGVNIIEEAPG